MDNSKYKALFLQETNERIGSIERSLIKLETDPFDTTSIEVLFRGYHSIKGMSASMGYESIQNFTHFQEDLLEGFRSGKGDITSETVGLLMECLDALKEMAGKVEEGVAIDIDTTSLVERLKGALSQEEPPLLLERPVTPTQVSLETNIPKETPSEDSAPPEELPIPQLRLPTTMRVEGTVFDEQLKITGDLLTTLSTLKKISQRSLSIEFLDAVHSLGKTIDELNSNILEARMLPIESIMHSLPRTVRDIAQRRDKDIELVLKGTEITLDRAILEGMGDPLIHIIRNAVDHGIEAPDIRVASGKPAKGRITVRAFDKGDHVLIEISDDGKGLDTDDLKEKALARAVSPEKINAMSDAELRMLICMPGLSLAKEVTDISGRGVGMDLVKSVVETLGGRLTIDSIKDKGTTFTIELPRTTSIVKVLLVRVGDKTLSLPLSKISRVMEIEDEFLSEETYALKESTVHIKRLGDILGVERSAKPSCDEKSSEKLIVFERRQGSEEDNGIVVDELIDEVDAYIRPLIAPFTRLWGTTGFTILGNGETVFLLDPAQITASFGETIQ